VKKKFEEDERTLLAFTSVSGDGLKVGCWLESTITDEKKFKDVCKHYAKVISEEYRIEADTTFDAARACFISSDPNIYVNYDCKRLSIDVGELKSLADMKKDSKPESLLTKWPGVSEGNRHNTLVKHTGECIRQGIPKDIARLSLLEWNKINKPPLGGDEVIDTVNDVYQRYANDVSRFIWCDDGNHIVFNNYQFKLFLERHGYYKYPLGSNYIIIRIQNGIIDIVEEYKLKEWTLGIIQDVRLKSYIMQKEGTIFTEGKMDFLNAFTGKINSDTADKSFQYFPDGYIVVTSEVVSSLKPYSTLSLPIWRSQIKNRKFKSIGSLFELRKSEFFQFCRKITAEKTDRLKALVSAIGYCCHSFYDPSNRRVVFLIDESHPDDAGLAQGGRGKGIVEQALRRFINNGAWVDASELDKKDMATYHNVSADTQLIIFDEVRRKFKFEKFFASVTEGITVNKKYKDPFILSNVKLFMTSNFTIAGDDISHKRRLFEIEIASYFNLQYTPRDEFGHNLLREGWDDELWRLFDNFILFCTSYYLRNGLVEYRKRFFPHNKLIAETCIEFFEYAKKFKIGTQYNKDKEFWLYNNEFAAHSIKKNTFTRWLRAFARAARWNYNEKSGPQNKFKWFNFSRRLYPPWFSVKG
jgi:hypothetical protein